MALLAVAAEASSPDQDYMPDFLVQTASIVDFFYPFVTEDAVSAETQLA